jgi:hypothetical protein
VNATEAGKLLGLIALYDNRKVGPEDVVAWLKAIGDLPFADCEQAAAQYYATETDRVMPGHIRQRVKAIRADRLARTPLPAPAPELADAPGRYRQAIQVAVQRIADGLSLRKAITAGPLDGPPPAEWQRARAALGHAGQATREVPPAGAPGCARDIPAHEQHAALDAWQAAQGKPA